MTREEMMKRIEELERQKFDLEMKDRWDRKDYVLNSNIMKEYCELQNKIKALN